jgi:hypothetical protein|tara:strand:- start:4702 stop:4902 length:201 start_codon:yes stop_codon:yes gene_type:complete
MEVNMKLINSDKEPTLLGVMNSDNDYKFVDQIVYNMNKDLVDSGFDQYQYKTIKRGNKLYIERQEV